MATSCPRSRPHPEHDWTREVPSPVLGTVRSTFHCPGVPIPAHLQPSACYVCGHPEHTDTTTAGGHRYWSNADAEREIRREPSAPAGYVEARYVEQTRGR